MPLSPRQSFQSRVILLVALGFLILLGGVGGFGFLSVRESIQRSLHERLVLARTTADHLEYLLELNLRQLQDISLAPGVDLVDGDLEPEKRALRDIYLHSLFDDGVYLLDRSGTVLWVEPPHEERLGADLGDLPYVRLALESGRPLVSDVTRLPSGRSVVAIASPVRDGDGRLWGVMVGEINLTGPRLAEVVQAGRLGETGYVDLVDSQGVVLASTRPEHVLETSDHGHRLADLIRERRTTEGTCHSCHTAARETEVLAFAPLPTLSWGVTVRQTEAEALAPARSLQWRLVALGAPLLGLGLFFGWGLALSVLRPVRALTAAAQRIAGGDLSQPVPSLGQDELGRLAGSFDQMRLRLKDSLEQSRQWGHELEMRVQERTGQLQELYQELQRKEAARGELLRKVMTAQEEERKRTARELHDDTSQTLVALVMAVDRLRAASPDGVPSRQGTGLATGSELVASRDVVPLAKGDHRGSSAGGLKRLRELAVSALDGVHRAIFDLRPSMLDDLGLVPAVRWYLETRLGALGVQVRLEVEGQERRLPGQVETVLFRVAQEALTNIARHAQAGHAVVSLQFHDSTVALQIEDDGQGFDAAALNRDGVRGLGLMGMRERVALLGGRFDLHSAPGSGTVVTARVPLVEGGSHGENQAPHRG